MKENNYIFNVINEIMEVLKNNDYRKKRYNQDIEWFKNRSKIIDNNIIRIAIIGITSSGKSTLVNTILGEKILPIAIKPSSSIIITCSKGECRKATVYFSDKEPEVLKGENLNHISIANYADENKNPNNKYKVTQIDITTPKFLLGENIHIIDSPGLDACDLEIHEKLTLEILLPTIDICIFLTTVKANSDEINANKIKMVNEKGKQIVLVQNMIDSIEEKLGRNGIVKEDKSTILKKHKKRAENLLKVGTNNESKFEVIQISALNALNGIKQKNKDLYYSSNIEEFIEAVETCVKKLIPRIIKDRVKSISERINRIIDTDREIIGLNDENIKCLGEIKISEIDELNNAFEISKNMISEKIKNIDNIIEDTINEIKNSEAESVENYLNIVDRINVRNLYIESEIFNIVKECESRKSDFYKKLNLDVRSSYSIPSIESKQIDIKHKYEERVRLVKKNGNLNKGKRLLSDIFNKNWGYEEEAYDEKVVDKDATINMVKKICNQNRRKYIEILQEWNEQYNKSLDIFYNEVYQREEIYEKKKNQYIEIYQIEEVINELNLIKSKFNLLNSNKDEEISVTLSDDNQKSFYSNNSYESNNYVEYSISNTVYNFYKLSSGIIEKNYLLLGNYIKEKSVKKINKQTEQVFWTWDLESCFIFISRVCGIHLGNKEFELLKSEGIYTFNNITIVYEECSNENNLNREVNNIKNRYYNAFLIFNGIQIGNSEKQIIESSRINNLINNNNVILNLVIDSFKEFINANSIKELLASVNDLEEKIVKRFINVKYGYTLINSKNPIYNMALIEGKEQDKFIISQYKEVKERLFENPLSRGEEEKKVLEEILIYFLNKSER